jgi:hypothetical protein
VPAGTAGCSFLKLSPALPDEVTVGQQLLPENPANGGFPEPPSGEPVRVIAARHDGCAEATRVRLPWTLPARAVRRVRCSECSRDFDAAVVEDVTAPPPRRLPLVDRFGPSSRAWQLASLGLATAAVIGGLLLIQGGDDQPETGKPAAAVAPRTAPPPPAGHGKRGHKGSGHSKASKHTTLVAGSSYHLALPAHWEQVNPPAGATFKAVAPDGDADVTLWIERDPGLAFDQFVSRSMRQLKSLTGSRPQVVDRVAAPTADNSVVRLAADAPPSQPSYEVTLRAAGDYRYYLAASVQPDASSEAAEGADLIRESFRPEGNG